MIMISDFNYPEMACNILIIEDTLDTRVSDPDLAGKFQRIARQKRNRQEQIACETVRPSEEINRELEVD